MKLFLLSRIASTKYETIYDAFVEKLIRAENEAEARKIANSHVGDECEVWEDPEQVICKVITLEGNPEVIITNYNAG